MPIANRLNIAKTSGYQNNCLLHCLTHAIARDYANVPLETKNSLLEAFRRHYGNPSLQLSDLETILNGSSPVHREIVFGPVLRRMLLNPKNRQEGATLTDGDDDFINLANRFGIKVESYYSWEASLGNATHHFSRTEADRTANPNKDIEENMLSLTERAQIQRIRDYGARDTNVLKLWHTPNHFELAIEDEPAGSQTRLNTHNEWFKHRHAYDGADYRNIQGRISSALRAGQRNLTPVFNQYEAEKASSPVPGLSGLFGSSGAFPNLFGGNLQNAIQAGQGGLANLFGVNGSNGPMNGIFGLFGPLIELAMKGISALFVGMRKIGKELNPGQPFDNEDNLVEGASDFGQHVKLLDESKQGPFYQQWRNNVKSGAKQDGLWLELLKQLAKEGQMEEADALLKAREQMALEKLSQIPSVAQKYKDILGGYDTPLAPDPSATAAAAGSLHHVGLEEAALDKADQSYRAENFKFRLEMLKRYFALERNLDGVQKQIEELPLGSKDSAIAAQQVDLENRKGQLVNQFNAGITPMYLQHEIGKMRPALQAVDKKEQEQKVAEENRKAQEEKQQIERDAAKERLENIQREIDEHQEQMLERVRAVSAEGRDASADPAYKNLNLVLNLLNAKLAKAHRALGMQAPNAEEQREHAAAPAA